MKKLSLFLFAILSCVLFIACEEEKVPVTDIALAEKSIALEVGQEKQLTATISPETATNKNLEWVSDNIEVATVSPDGLVSAIAGGEAKITVSSSENPSIKDICNVTVALIAPSEFALNSIDPQNLPKEDLWIITDESAQSGVRELKFTNGSPYDSGNKPMIEGEGDFKLLYDALVEADNAGRKISIILKNMKEIPYYAFFDTQLLIDKGASFEAHIPRSLVSVEAPEATSMGYGALGYTSMSSAKLNKMKKLSNSAFMGNSSLTELVLPEVEEAEQWSISFCIKLESVELPKAKLIGTGSISFCDELKTVKLDNLEEVGESAFFNNPALQEVDLPKVKTVVKQAFSGCIAMRSANIPMVETIGENSFAVCTGLTELTLATSSVVENVDVKAFEGVNLSKITLTTGNANNTFVEDNKWIVPFGNTSIEFGPFASVIGGDAPIEEGYMLADIPEDGSTIEEDIWIIKDETAVSAEYFSRLRNAINSAGREISVVFTNLTSIPNSAFVVALYSPLNNMVAIEGPRVTSIGDDAFNYCSVLASLNFPSLETIGYNSFYYNPKLTTVNLPELVTLGEQAFYYCNALTTVELPKMEVLGKKAFEYCSALESVEFPAVKTVGVAAFNHCGSLVDIKLPNVETIEDWAFNASSITSMTLATNSTLISMSPDALDNFVAANIDLITAENNGTTTDETQTKWNVPYQSEGATETLEVGPFKSITGATIHIEPGYTLANIPEDGTTIEGDIWIIKDETAVSAEYFSRLRNAINSAGRDITLVLSKMTSIPNDAFVVALYSPLNNMVAVEGPKVKTIGDNAFNYCSVLASLNFPKLETIGYNSFYYNPKLTALDLPELITLGEQSFYYCNALTSLNLPKVEEVGKKAFEYCSALESVELPSARIIKATAFNYCGSLVDIKLPNVETIEGWAFSSTSLATITLATTSTLMSMEENAIDTSGLANIDLITGANNGTTVDEAGKTWTVPYVDSEGVKSDINIGEFKSIMVK